MKNKNAVVKASENKVALKEHERRVRAATKHAIEAGNEFESRGEAAYKAAVELGQALVEAEPEVPYGDWVDWMKINGKGLSVNTLRGYMKVARNASVAFLSQPKSLAEAYKLLSKSREEDAIDVEEVTDQKSLAAPATAPQDATKCQSIVADESLKCERNALHIGYHRDGRREWEQTREEMAAAEASIRAKEANIGDLAPALNNRVVQAAGDLLASATQKPITDTMNAVGAPAPLRVNIAEMEDVKGGFASPAQCEAALLSGKLPTNFEAIVNGSKLVEERKGEPSTPLRDIVTPRPQAAAPNELTAQPDWPEMVGHWLETPQGVEWEKLRVTRVVTPATPLQLTPEAVDAWLDTDPGKAWQKAYDATAAEVRRALAPQPTPEERKATARAEREAKELAEGRCVKVPTGPPLTVKLMQDALKTLSALVPSDADHKAFGEVLSTASAEQFKIAQSAGKKQASFYTT